MGRATAHPDHRLISSEDVHGTDVIGAEDDVVGEIDHLLIEKISERHRRINCKTQGMVNGVLVFEATIVGTEM